ncbi:hypothetical protein ASPVEDRAFT_47964 [Aspergillus versicolor CBS 583.65]|uniref:Glutathione S-transferase n=1 Tax=Aspergillus versicolor CBS 583.65 TaxID=1036611 RepID=A0A1L9Q4Z3_ASPVE|nr:uncharacterized protein ASPVEDRAFT_47964 [Aspergillus versicolor CBS 583.65]OJJ08809.1 hypothetical protein ASPVEDRAFT_47964 [Aspergillus versicolor CBS 583.65]
MSFGTIYSYPQNPRVAKIHAVANLNGLKIEDAPFEFGKTNKSPEFLAKFPLGKAPAFSGTDGVNIFESNAIAHYVADSGPLREQLLGSNAAERAAVQQWVTMAETEVMPPAVTIILPRFGLGSFDQGAEDQAVSKLERSVESLERHLSSGKTWLAGEKISLADISIAASLVWGFTFAIDAEMRNKYPGVVAWYERVMATEGVKKAFGETKFVEKRTAPK